MKTSRQTPRGPEVFDELALRLQQMVKDVHTNEASGVERFQVQHVSPLIITQLHGELVLEDGDPDFTIGETLKARLTAATVHNGDLIWCARSADQEWHAFDVVSS